MRELKRSECIKEDEDRERLAPPWTRIASRLAFLKSILPRTTIREQLKIMAKELPRLREPRTDLRRGSIKTASTRRMSQRLTTITIIKRVMM